MYLFSSNFNSSWKWWMSTDYWRNGDCHIDDWQWSVVTLFIMEVVDG